MTALQGVEWEDCFLEPRKDSELERLARQSYGIVPPFVPYLAPCPWLVEDACESNFHDGVLVHIDVSMAERIFLNVSQDNSCRYCYASQRAALRILGFDEERIRSLEEAAFVAAGDPRERLALDFARRVSRSNPPPGAADAAALREAGYSADAVRELAYMAAHTAAANRISTLTALPLDRVERAQRSFWLRLFRPFVARSMRARNRPGQPEFLDPEQKTGPFAFVPNALDGLPAARILRRSLDRAFASPILPRRLKALVFAVVARGLGSERTEQEATAMLAEEGLGPADVADILAHLASPKLEPREAVVVLFARETVRYRSSDIQRRARELQQELAGDEFLELVGVVGSANAIGRLSLVLCEA